MDVVEELRMSLFEKDRMEEAHKKMQENNVTINDLASIVGLETDDLQPKYVNQNQLFIWNKKTRRYIIIDINTHKIIENDIEHMEIDYGFCVFVKNRERFLLGEKNEKIILSDGYRLIFDSVETVLGPNAMARLQEYKTIYDGGLVYTGHGFYSPVTNVEHDFPHQINYFIYEFRTVQGLVVYSDGAKQRIADLKSYPDKNTIAEDLIEGDEISPTSDKRFWKVKDGDLYGIYDLVTKSFVGKGKTYLDKEKIDIRIENNEIYLIGKKRKGIKERKEKIGELEKGKEDYRTIN